MNDIRTLLRNYACIHVSPVGPTTTQYSPQRQSHTQRNRNWQIQQIVHRRPYPLFSISLVCTRLLRKTRQSIYIHACAGRNPEIGETHNETSLRLYRQLPPSTPPSRLLRITETYQQTLPQNQSIAPEMLNSTLWQSFLNAPQRAQDRSVIMGIYNCLPVIVASARYVYTYVVYASPLPHTSNARHIVKCVSQNEESPNETFAVLNTHTRETRLENREVRNIHVRKHTCRSQLGAFLWTNSTYYYCSDAHRQRNQIWIWKYALYVRIWNYKRTHTRPLHTIDGVYVCMAYDAVFQSSRACISRRIAYTCTWRDTNECQQNTQPHSHSRRETNEPKYICIPSVQPALRSHLFANGHIDMYIVHYSKIWESLLRAAWLWQ